MKGPPLLVFAKNGPNTPYLGVSGLDQFCLAGSIKSNAHEVDAKDEIALHQAHPTALMNCHYCSSNTLRAHRQLPSNFLWPCNELSSRDDASLVYMQPAALGFRKWGESPVIDTSRGHDERR